jgi:glucose/mannose-6-phosphate isomerase
MSNNIYDKSNMLSIIKAMPEQIKEAYNTDIKIKLKGKPSNIIICGMGGSSIAGQILESYAEIPIYNTQGYDLPKHVNNNSLIFIVSYSGNTEESLSCYKAARRNNHNIIAFSTGGKLLEHARNEKIPYIELPKGLQPRNAIAYLFFPMLKILENSEWIEPQESEVKSLIQALKDTSFEYKAMDLADKLVDKLPVIYSSEKYYPVAYRWKCEINENSKVPAFCNKFPELNHNELNGYVNYNSVKIPVHIIILKAEDDHRRVQKRMDITKKLIKKMIGDKISFTELSIKGDKLSRYFTTIYLGDLVSYYLALKYATDPTPVDIIEEFKKEMGPYIG